jgi:large subunit ribosomal protein L10
MAKTKEQKKEVIEKIKQHLEKQKVIFFIDFQNLKSEQIFELRKKLREINGLLYIVKKNLIKIAFQDKKIPIDIEQFGGQLGLVFGFENEIIPAKIIYNIWEKHKIPEILGGFYKKEFISANQAIEMGKLPSEEELQSRLVGNIAAPLPKFANILQANIKGLIMALNAIKSQ